METTGSPRFLDNPNAHAPFLFGPDRISTVSAITTELTWLPRASTAFAPVTTNVSRLNKTVVCSLCTLHAADSSTPRNTQFRLAASLYRAGVITGWVALQGFRFCFLHTLPPHPSFAWHTEHGSKGQRRYDREVGVSTLAARAPACGRVPGVNYVIVEPHGDVSAF